MNKHPPYWFKVRDPRFGTGWGRPLTWQGWAVSIAYLVLFVGGIIFVLPYSVPIYFAGLIFFTALFFLICVRKGEPLAWQDRIGHR